MNNILQFPSVYYFYPITPSGFTQEIKIFFSLKLHTIQKNAQLVFFINYLI